MKNRISFPWGLVIALAAYGAIAAAYLSYRYWNSPSYQAAIHYQQAWQILGGPDSKSLTVPTLLTAYEHLLESARLMPEVRQLHEQLEDLNAAVEKRGQRVPMELRNRSEAVAAIWARIQEERRPILVVGARDRGWAPDQLVEGPAQLMKGSLLGAGAIILIWLWIRFSGRLH